MSSRETAPVPALCTASSLARRVIESLRDVEVPANEQCPNVHAICYYATAPSSETLPMRSISHVAACRVELALLFARVDVLKPVITPECGGALSRRPTPTPRDRA